MTIHNYIRRTSLQDMVFMEFDRHPNYVPDDLFTDMAPHSQVQKNHWPLHMN